MGGWEAWKAFKVNGDCWESLCRRPELNLASAPEVLLTQKKKQQQNYCSVSTHKIDCKSSCTKTNRGREKEDDPKPLVLSHFDDIKKIRERLLKVVRRLAVLSSPMFKI